MDKRGDSGRGRSQAQAENYKNNAHLQSEYCNSNENHDRTPLQLVSVDLRGPCSLLIGEKGAGAVFRQRRKSNCLFQNLTLVPE
jgi:hypothetical protein